MQTTLVMHALAPISLSNTPIPVTGAALKDPEHAATTPSAASVLMEKDEVRPDQPVLKQNVAPSSDEEETTTTSIITTMQSPGEQRLTMLSL